MAVIYLCPVDKRLLCSWEGYASDIKQHFEKEHSGLLFSTNSIEIDLSVSNENRLMHLDGKIYLIQTCKESNSKLFLRLRYLGSNLSASRIQYNVVVTIKDISYKYEPQRKISVVKPTREGWEVDLGLLENFYAKLDSLTCTILTENLPSEDVVDIRRKVSDISLKINNRFVEKNVCDATEASYLEAINLTEGRIKQLRNERESDDLMDKISHLNFSMLEEPFSDRKTPDETTSLNDYITEILPDIPEELNLACASCSLDMLPPIFLCINGHSVCSWCKRDPCKKCQGVITITRNTDLENVSRTHKHYCRYASDGCNEKLLYNEVKAHEAKCQFCKYKCLSDCPFEDKFQHFVNHLKIVHPSIKISDTLRNYFPKNLEMYVVNKSVGIFYCKSEANDDFITWRAEFCGPKERQFFCELSFKGSKFKEPMFLKRQSTTYEIVKSVSELKKMKAKEKYALLTITSYDN